jgi:predicted alpha-1,2-mannosidase
MSGTISGSIPGPSARLPAPCFALALVMLAACSSSSGPAAVANPNDYALPTAGSGGFGFAAGSAFPGAAAPNGLAKVGPDTTGKFGTFLHYSGYWYDDDTVQGFSHLHLHGTGATDYGVLAVMPFWPTAAAPPVNTSQYKLPLDKASEKASPGRYALVLKATQGDIRAELTATTHAAHHRYTFGDGSQGGAIVLDLDHHLEGGSIKDAEVALDVPQNRVRGRLRSVGQMSGGFGGYDVFFELQARRAWTGAQVWSQGAPPHDGASAGGQGVGVALRFADAGPVELQVGLSLVSAEGARRNLEAELTKWDFEATAAQTAAAWRALLSRLTVSGGSEDERRTFYSQLYHSFLMPTVMSDVDGAWRGSDGAVHAASGFRYLSDFSLWDTYRTLHPLYGLAYPDLARESVQSLLQMARERGSFPRWPIATGEAGTMIGASAEIVVADAYLRGVTGFDAAEAYARMKAAALDATPPPGGRGGRDNLESYDAHGYVPQDATDRSVSWTTEFAHDDFALMNLATALGDGASAARLETRRHGWQKLWDPASGFLRARNSDGSLVNKAIIDPTTWLDEYAEADAWQSLFAVPHDVDGLAAVLGGKQAAIDKLTTFFTQAQTEWQKTIASPALRALPRPYFWAGNEPDLHAPWLFAQLGRPDLTQQWSRWAGDTFFSSASDGTPGNDDGGALGAFYVFTALGIYPLPGSDVWIVGAPRFPRVQVALGKGVFTIEAPAASKDNLYVQGVTLDGKPISTPFLKHADLKAGGTLTFVMGPKASNWGQ